MQNRSEQIRAFLLQNVSQHSQDITSIAADKFQVSRTTIHRHLHALIKRGELVKSGTTRNILYYLANSRDKKYHFSTDKKLSEYDIWKNNIVDNFSQCSQNALDILDYGFTEIFNNAIDHSAAKNIMVSIKWQGSSIVHLTIKDDGIGVFEKINNVLHFYDPRECLLHLTKGKLTTDPINHTGEGIFFTSRIFDKFILSANTVIFYRDNLNKDWTVETSDDIKGTTIEMILDITTSRTIGKLFNKYTELENYTFNKTDLLVDLSLLDGEVLMSRSQAKRLLSRLESFKNITLDFAKVRMVGQGFVDEIFRVYTLKNPAVEISYINANEDVSFMIKRGLS